MGGGDGAWPGWGVCGLGDGVWPEGWVVDMGGERWWGRVILQAFRAPALCTIFGASPLSSFVICCNGVGVSLHFPSI